MKESERKKILVIEDDQRVLETIVRVLKYWNTNYEILTSDNGYRASLAIDEILPDLVILDIMLPWLDGFKIAEKIKKDHKNKIKILAITGSDPKRSKKRIMNAGADVFMSKPFKYEDLIENVNVLLNKL